MSIKSEPEIHISKHKTPQINSNIIPISNSAVNRIIPMVKNLPNNRNISTSSQSVHSMNNYQIHQKYNDIKPTYPIYNDINKNQYNILKQNNKPINNIIKTDISNNQIKNITPKVENIQKNGMYNQMSSLKNISSINTQNNISQVPLKNTQNIPSYNQIPPYRNINQNNQAEYISITPSRNDSTTVNTPSYNQIPSYRNINQNNSQNITPSNNLIPTLRNINRDQPSPSSLLYETKNTDLPDSFSIDSLLYSDPVDLYDDPFNDIANF